MSPPINSPETAVCSALTTALPADGRAPAWVQLLPGGSFRPNDGRAGWTLKDAASVIAASLSAAPHGVLGIDYDHAADLAAPKGGAAPAAGWIVGLEDRDGGIWGKVDWTDAGARAIAAKEYRFLSPSFLHTKDGTVSRIVGAGLTNRPALSGLPALASSQGNMMDPMLSAILEALGLPNSADQATALAAIAKMKDGTSAATASAVPDPALYVPRTLYDQASLALVSMRSNLTLEQVNSKVNVAISAGKLPPAQRGWAMALCHQDPSSFDAFVSAAPPVFANLSHEVVPSGAPGEHDASGRLTPDQRALCASMNLNPADYAKNL